MADPALAKPAQGLAAFLQGAPCPKCGYARRPSDANPEWQCPKCHVAYLKVVPRPPLIVRYSEGARELAAEGAADRSVYTLLATNLFTAAVALVSGMDLRDLMLVYWVQSIIIGLSFFVRILALKSFSTEGVNTASGQMAASGASKGAMAFFFLFHYNFFHFGYLVFIVVGTPWLPGALEDPKLPATGLAACAIAFAANHAYSLFQNIRVGRQGKPNIGTLMGLPYARIVPMHVIILGGNMLVEGVPVMLFFIALKTAADVVMHSVEHHVLRKGR